MLLELLIPAVIYSENVDPFTDAKSAMMALVTDDFSLAVKCDEAGPGSIYALFVSKEYLGHDRISDGWRPLDIRFDKHTPIQYDWQYGRTNAIRTGDGAKFVAADLIRSKKVAIRAYRYDGKMVTVATEYTINPPDIGKLVSVCDPSWLSSIQ